MTLQDNELLFKQLKLKLSINKYLSKWGNDYSTNVFNFVHCIDVDFFHSVVDQMEREGMLVKERNERKTLILSYRALPSEVQVCQQVKAPKEAVQG
jgi:hypothetical protein